MGAETKTTPLYPHRGTNRVRGVGRQKLREGTAARIRLCPANQ
jgi:hypothetical protein